MPWTPFDPVDLGLAVRALRKERRLTQAELAERAGLAYETVSRVETGREPPSLRTAMALADALEEPLDSVVGRRRTDESPRAGARGRPGRETLLDQLLMAAGDLPLESLEDLVRLTSGLTGRPRRR
jgi:transcriptional regulator with XRE-family HTH domain